MRRTLLIKARKTIEKTQKEVANELGISTVYLRKLESGQANPGRIVMIKLENYYGITMRELFQDIFLSTDDTKNINM